MRCDQDHNRVYRTHDLFNRGTNADYNRTWL